MDVWGNGISAKALCDLCDAVVEHGAHRLRRLDIGRNQLSGGALASIVRVLKSDVPLEHVGIEQTFHGGVYAHRTTSGDGGGRQLSIAAVINAVRDCPTLTSLDFTGHGIFPEEMSRLIASLLEGKQEKEHKYGFDMNWKEISSQKNKQCCISDLFLGSNRLGERGALLLANAIAKGGLGRSLRALGLSCNDIGGKGALGLMTAYMSIISKKWRLLDLSHNNITTDVMNALMIEAETLGELLDRDKVVRTLDLSRNQCIEDHVHSTDTGSVVHEEDDDDDDFDGNVVPNLWSYSAWFGPAASTESSEASTVSESKQVSDDWLRTLRRLRGVAVVSTVESAPGSSKLHGLSLHTWQGRLRKELSNFKGVEGT